MKAIVGTINQERALVEALSVIVKTSEGLFPALLSVLPLQSYTMFYTALCVLLHTNVCVNQADTGVVEISSRSAGTRHQA